jgi:sugar lactone lactonase YvrE
MDMVIPTEDYYPEHDGGKFAPILATVATWRARAFLENVAIDAEGVVFVTVYSHNRVDRYDPATRAVTEFVDVPAPPMGLAFDASGALWMTAGTLRKGPGYVYRVERDGAVRQWCEFSDALFINGCTMHPNGRTLLACESASGSMGSHPRERASGRVRKCIFTCRRLAAHGGRRSAG